MAKREHTGLRLPLDGGRAPSAVSAFGSMRFDGVVPPAAEELQIAMAERGASLEIVNMYAPPFRHSFPRTPILIECVDASAGWAAATSRRR